MARNYESKILTYEQADIYLGNKKERPLPHCNNLRIRRVTTMLGTSGLPELTGEIVVTLHGNIIVVWRCAGKEAEFPYRGMYKNTITTKRHRSAFGGPWKVV